MKELFFECKPSADFFASYSSLRRAALILGLRETHVTNIIEQIRVSAEQPILTSQITDQPAYKRNLWSRS